MPCAAVQVPGVPKAPGAYRSETSRVWVVAATPPAAIALAGTGIKVSVSADRGLCRLPAVVHLFWTESYCSAVSVGVPGPTRPPATRRVVPPASVVAAWRVRAFAIGAAAYQDGGGPGTKISVSPRMTVPRRPPATTTLPFPSREAV